MHYSNLAIIPSNGDDSLDAKVSAVMGPHEDDGGFWDWYQIGGRWTGTLDGYEPEKDERNMAPCDLCGATGKRAEPPNVGPGELPCNGCDGTGIKVNWPGQWVRHDGDVMPVEKLTAEHVAKFYRFCLPGKVIEVENTGEVPLVTGVPLQEWLKRTFPDHLCVVVDNHS